MLPPQLLPTMETLAQPFGGLSVVERVLGPKQLQDLVTFNGPILLMQPGAYELDLALYGVDRRTLYNVYNSDMEYLYSDWTRAKPSAPDEQTWYGLTARDISVINSVQNGDFLYFTFADGVNWRTVILWVQLLPTPADLKFWFDRWLETHRVLTSSESYLPTLIVRLDALRDTPSVAVYYLNTPDYRQPSQLEMRTQGKRVADYVEENQVFHPEQTGWYMFTQSTDPTQVLGITNLSGQGTNTITLNNQGVYYVKTKQVSQGTIQSYAQVMQGSLVSTKTPLLMAQAHLVPLQYISQDQPTVIEYISNGEILEDQYSVSSPNLELNPGVLWHVHDESINEFLQTG